MSQNGAAIVSFGLAGAEKEAVYKGERGLMHGVAKELFSLGESQMEAGNASSFSVTFHALQVFQNKCFDLLRHPKEILTASDMKKSPHVSLAIDETGACVPGKAVEFEIEREEQFGYQFGQALKNVQAYSYAFYGANNTTKDSSHLVFWLNFYIERDGQIHRSQVKFIDVCGSEQIDFSADSDLIDSPRTEQNKSEMLSVSSLLKAPNTSRRLESRAGLFNNLSAMAGEITKRAEGQRPGSRKDPMAAIISDCLDHLMVVVSVGHKTFDEATPGLHFITRLRHRIQKSILRRRDFKASMPQTVLSALEVDVSQSDH